MNNLNLIIGEEKELTDFHLLNILKKITYHDEDKLIFDMTNTNLGDVLDEASMISLFSNTKVIIANNLDISKIKDDDTEYLTKYVNDYNKNVYIIFITNKIDARLKIYKLFKEYFNIVEISKINNNNKLQNYVKDIISSKKYQIDNINITYFIDKVGNDINNINLELDKLFKYKESDKTILKEDIDLLIIDNIDNIIYEFTNAVLENNLDKITKMYSDFKKENVSIDYLITSLSNAYRQAIIIKIMHNDSKSNIDIAKTIGKKEFYVKKMLERTYKYTIKDLGNFITKLAKIDYDYKSGKSNTDMLELFLYTQER